MRTGLRDVAEAYERLKDEVEPLLFMARDVGLQRDGMDLVRQFVDHADRERLSAILAGDDHAANDLLALAAVAKSLSAQLHLYVLLKEGESERAWARLIDAQDYTLAASRASEALTNLGAKFAHLRELETWLFPPQTFLSGGFVARVQECSICNDSYDKCDHIAGRAYGGRFCNVALKQIRPDHVALVEDPYDRRCRVTAFSAPGGMRNKITGVVAPKPGNSGEKATAIIASTGAPSDDL